LKNSGDVFLVADSFHSFIPGGVGYLPVTVSENGVLIFGGSGSSQMYGSIGLEIDCPVP
jgi:hypothetical protein